MQEYLNSFKIDTTVYPFYLVQAVATVDIAALLRFRNNTIATAKETNRGKFMFALLNVMFIFAVLKLG